jgi:competence ComEA-like helix-hairpin-helix protein
MKKFSFIMFVSVFLFTILAPNVSAQGSFTDVNYYEKEINYLTDLEIINGYPNNTFKPTNSISRIQAVQMIIREMDVTLGNAPNPGFSDIGPGDYGYEVVAKAVELGIIKGKNNGTYFDVWGELTRAQMAKILSEAYNIEGSYALEFEDVPSDHWAHDYVEGLAANNITTGYADNTFKPFNKISRQHFAVFMARYLDDIFKPQPEMKVHFINVGQGDSSLIVSPNGKTMLIDGGDRGAGDEVVSYLNQLGIYTIDLMVSTHPDEDHIGGLIDVLQQVKVNKVLLSGKEHTTDTYMEYMSLIDQKNIPVNFAIEGNYVNFDEDLKVEVLNSTSGSSSLNEASVVLKLTYGTVDFMLTGDAFVENELDMVRDYNVEAEILKVGHHGSNTSTSATFLNEVDPEVGILSYGDNSYGHPTSEVVNRLWDYGVNLYSTCTSGDIVVNTNGVNYNVAADLFTGSNDSCGTSIGDGATDPDPEPETQFPINVNTADYETLQLIKGVGPTIAQNIIDYRNTYGPFQTIDELDNVSYIGPATLDEMRPYITL